MKIIARPRQGGKTYEMVQWLKEADQRVLIVSSAREAQFIRETYHLGHRQVVTVGLMRPELLARGHTMAFGIDNLDMVLYALLGRTPVMASLTASATTLEA
jgi:hypothetical protein